MTAGPQFQRLDGHIRDLAQRAQIGAPMSESDISEAIGRFEQLIAHLPGDIPAESEPAIMASRMETHRAVMALLHQRGRGESQPEPQRAQNR